MNKSIHFVLDNQLTWLLIHMVSHQWFAKELCLCYVTLLILDSFYNWTANKSRHYVLDILQFFMYHYVTNQWTKEDNMCQLINWLDYWYIWYCTSDTVFFCWFPILLSWFLYDLVTEQWIKSSTIYSIFYCVYYQIIESPTSE